MTGVIMYRLGKLRMLKIVGAVTNSAGTLIASLQARDTPNVNWFCSGVQVIGSNKVYVAAIMVNSTGTLTTSYYDPSPKAGAGSVYGEAVYTIF